MTRINQGPAYERYDRLTSGPITALAFLMIPVLLIPLIHRLHGSVAVSFETADYVIWGMFAVDYVARLYLAQYRVRFIRTHLLDLAVVALPFLRPLRVLRELRALRLLVFLVTGSQHARDVLRHHGLQYVLLVVIAAMFMAAGLEFAVERGAPGGSIHSYGDALWWAVTTITTVGYGDKYPVTAAGRGIAVALMVTGIALFGTVTATIASFFVEQGQDRQADERIDDILRVVRSLEAQLANRNQQNVEFSELDELEGV